MAFLRLLKLMNEFLLHTKSAFLSKVWILPVKFGLICGGGIWFWDEIWHRE